MPRRKEESDSESDEEMPMKKSQKGNKSGDKLRWVNWVKKWSKENNKTYGCALSDPLCSGEYNEHYGIQKPKLLKSETNASKRRQHAIGENAVKMDRMSAKERIARRKANEEVLERGEEDKKMRQAKKLEFQERLKRGEIPIFRGSNPTLLVKQNLPPPAPVARRPAPVRRPKGRGMTTMNHMEDTNGLTHIYPLTHGQIVKIASR
jgi:hypothetical protein